MPKNPPKARYIVYRISPKLFYTEQGTWTDVHRQAVSMTYSEAFLLLERMKFVDPKNCYVLEFTGIERA